MKKLLPYLIIVILGSCDNDDAWNCVQTTGDAITREYRYDQPIYSITIHDDINVILHNHRDQFFEIETGINMLPEIDISIEENHLHVRNLNGCRWSRNPGNVDFHIFTDTLQLLVKKTIGRVYSEEEIEYSFQLITEESGTVDLLVNNDAIQIEIGKLNNVSISGQTNALGVYIVAGDSRFLGENLMVRRASIVHNGINQVHVNVSDRLRYYLWSEGDILLYQEPSILELIEQRGNGNLIRKY